MRCTPSFVGTDAASHGFSGGTLWLDREKWDETATNIVLEHAGSVFEKDADGGVRLSVAEEDLGKRDSELVACEVECFRAGKPVFFVDLAIEGLEACS